MDLLPLVAPDVRLITGFPRYAVNAYLVGDVLIDAGIRRWRPKLTAALADNPPRLLALTHVHPDHQGAARAICQHFGCPLACHEADRAAMEGREPMHPRTPWIRLSRFVCSGPPHPVTQLLGDGDVVAAGFRVIHTPGHTPGHVAFFRERDGTAIVGDMMNGMNLLTTRPGLHEPPGIFTWRSDVNRRSIRALAGLHPRRLLFGHGPPMTACDALDRLAAAISL